MFVDGHDLIDVGSDQGHGLVVAGTNRLRHFGHVAQVGKLLQLQDELHVPECLDQWDDLQLDQALLPPFHKSRNA